MDGKSVCLRVLESKGCDVRQTQMLGDLCESVLCGIAIKYQAIMTEQHLSLDICTHISTFSLLFISWKYIILSFCIWWVVFTTLWSTQKKKSGKTVSLFFFYPSDFHFFLRSMLTYAPAHVWCTLTCIHVFEMVNGLFSSAQWI